MMASMVSALFAAGHFIRVLSCRYLACMTDFSNRLKLFQMQQEQLLSRRTLLKGLGAATLLLRPTALTRASSLFGPLATSDELRPIFPFADIRLTPHYPSPSPLADVLRLVPPGSDDYVTEKYSFEIEALLKLWGASLKTSVGDSSHLSHLLGFLDPAIAGCTLTLSNSRPLRTGFGMDIIERTFNPKTVSGCEQFAHEVSAWLEGIARVSTAEFEIDSIEELAGSPTAVRTEIRYNLVSTRKDGRCEERVGSWRTEWDRSDQGLWKARKWEVDRETLAIAQSTAFIDVTTQALGASPSYQSQLLLGTDHWRTIMDGACGIDVYGNNGIAVGDYDSDGFDDFYICQPAGLPNRLYRNRGDGTFEDVTDKAGVGVLDNTACALFADFDNKGVQDLLVVCSSGPLLFQNQGNGTFQLKRDAFKFARPPQGSFTHAAIADYDGDGRLDIYFCMYSYYLGLDQYHYPAPYFDARNGPPNSLLHNEGKGTFVETTEPAGLSVDNDRYSFACAWGDISGNGRPDLSVANDFGRAQLYRNDGNGKFTVVSSESGVDDVGAGMGVCWSDFDNDGRQDIYVTGMWEAAGQRVAGQKQFQPSASPNIRASYQRHARGNALYRNLGDGKFENAGQRAAARMGRWSWGADFFDFDHDGYSDLYVANGYISASSEFDLASFFWRQVVARSPDDSTPSLAYEQGWNAINELIRSDSSWNGSERNVMFANNRDGTFSEVSGAIAMDFLEDSRSFALADIDHDGRLEVFVKNRNAPQLRILHNVMKEIGDSVAFRLRGVKSNRDAIGAAVIVETGDLRQSKYLQAGSGFLSQHSKELFFGVGKPGQPIRATIRWPSGLTQRFENIPVNHRIEITEGDTAFGAKPFSAAPSIFAKAAAPLLLQPLPVQVETWLLQPIKAPEFSLPDLGDTQRQLSQSRGSLTLLSFWTTTSAVSLDQLKLFRRHRSELAANSLTILAPNLDDPAKTTQARALAVSESFAFPILFATEEVAGIYNIISRYLFDRRRDLAIPTSFLIDREGMIVKIYQGAIDIGRLIEDAKSIPTNLADRIKKALPFEGQLYQGTFQRNDFTYGVAMYQHGYLDQAAESFQQVVAAKPDNAEGYYNLGTLNLRKKEYAQARQYLQKTLQLRPNYPEAWNNLGMIAAQHGNAQEAIENFQRSLAQRPAYATALLNLGNVYRRQGAYPQAQESLDHALELQPDDPETNYSLGMLYAQQQQMPRAIDYLQKAIASRPEYPEALNNLGIIFVRLQNYPQAEEQFKSCIQRVPKFDQSYLNLARLYALQNKRDQAKSVLQDLLRLEPENTTAARAIQSLQ